MPETPIRKVRIEDDLWEAFTQLARENGQTPSSRIRLLITEDVRENS
ncbi:hypothetical protein [Microbacterium sp. KNMS]